MKAVAVGIGTDFSHGQEPMVAWKWCMLPGRDPPARAAKWCSPVAAIWARARPGPQEVTEGQVSFLFRRERETGEAFIPLNVSRRFQRMSTQVAQIQSLCAHWLLSFCCSYLRPTFQCDFFSSTGFKNLRYRCGEMRSVCIIPESVVFFLETLFTTSSLCSQLHGCNY